MADEKKLGMIVADDIEMNRSVIKKMFKHDFDIYEAETGTGVFDILKEHKIDVILLDIIMPQMDGLEALTKIKSDEAYRDIAVLVATSTKEKTERNALSLGADDIVSKPYDPVVIRKRIDNILETRKMKALLKANMSDEEYTYGKVLRERVGQELSTTIQKVDIWSANLQSNMNDETQVQNYMQNIKNELRNLERLLGQFDLT